MAEKPIQPAQSVKTVPVFSGKVVPMESLAWMVSLVLGCCRFLLVLHTSRSTCTWDCGLEETGNLHVKRDVIREDGESSNTNVKAPSNRHQPAIVCVHRWSEIVLLLSICSLLFSQIQHFEKFNYFLPWWKLVCKLSACLKPCAWREYQSWRRPLKGSKHRWIAESSMLSFLATFS